MTKNKLHARRLIRAATGVSPEAQYNYHHNFGPGFPVNVWVRDRRGAKHIPPCRQVDYDTAGRVFEFTSVAAGEFFFKMPEDDKRTLLLIVANALLTEEGNHD